MEANDEELVNLCLSGDKDAFGELVTRYQGVVYGLAYHLVGNFEDARDLAQEAFIRAYTRLSDLRDKAKFASWLKRVTFSFIFFRDYCHELLLRPTTGASLVLRRKNKSLFA